MSNTTTEHALVDVGHVSCQSSDTLPQWRHDADVVFSRQYDWVTGTEVGARKHWRILRRAARSRGYRIKRYKSNWVAIDKTIIKPRSLKWGGRVIVEKEKVHGKGHDTNMLWGSFEHRNPRVGRISVVASHYPTKGQPYGNKSRRRNLRWTRKAGRVISRKMARLGRGFDLAFYGGDQNISAKRADTFFGGPVVACWDEVNRYPGTGHGNIDVIARYAKDKRVSCVDARAFTDAQLFLHSDHFLIEARYRIALW